MDREQTIAKLQNIAQEVFNSPEIQFSENTELDAIKDWSSLTHVMFMDAVEKEFEIQFSFEQMLGLNTIKAICEVLEANRT